MKNQLNWGLLIIVSGLIILLILITTKSKKSFHPETCQEMCDHVAYDCYNSDTSEWRCWEMNRQCQTYCSNSKPTNREKLDAK